MTRQLLTAEQVAEILQASPARIYQLARDGRIAGVVRIGRQVRFHPSELESWIESGGCAASHGDSRVLPGARQSIPQDVSGTK